MPRPALSTLDAMPQEITRRFFERRLQTTFRVTPDLGAPSIGLTLQAIKSIHTPLLAPTPRLRRPSRPLAPSSEFALLFHGPVHPVLHQSIYMLRTEPQDGTPEVPFFLIPLGLAPHPYPAMQYEVFCSDEEDGSSL